MEGVRSNEYGEVVALLKQHSAEGENLCDGPCSALTRTRPLQGDFVRLGAHSGSDKINE